MWQNDQSVSHSLSSIACMNLLPSRMGVKFRVPLQKLHPLSRAIHHRYSANNNPQRPPHCSAARHYTSLSRLPMRPHKSRSGGHGYQQHRSFWVARLAARLLKLRYILLGSAVGGGYTAKKVCLSSWLCCAYKITGSRSLYLQIHNESTMRLNMNFNILSLLFVWFFLYSISHQISCQQKNTIYCWYQVKYLLVHH